MSLAEVLSFIIASVVLAFTPGPDILFVIVTALSEGLGKAIKFILGLCSGIIIHTFLIVIGVSTLISQSAYGLKVLQFFAAGYLIWLAYKTFIYRHEKISLDSPKKVENYYLRGFIMNVSNPKVMLFFLAFFPQFANLNQSGYQIRLVVLGLLFIVVTISVFSFVAWFAAKGREKMLESPKYSLWINWVAIFVFLAISILLLLENLT